MNRKPSRVKKALLVILPLILLLAVIVRLKHNSETAKLKVYHFDRNQPVPVKALVLKAEPVNATTSVTGTFEPYKESRISADQPGKINSLLVDIGHNVRKGQPLLHLDNSLLKIQLRSADVQISGLRDDVRRYTILTKADAVQGIQLEKATLGLQAALVQRENLLEQIRKTTIRAPFDGVVTAKFSDEGAFAAPGVPLLQITDISRLKFTVNVPENDLPKFSYAQYRISADAYPGLLISGKTLVIGSKANAGNSFPVQLLVTNTAKQHIRSGMFGKLVLPSPVNQEAIQVPSSAIVAQSGQSQVYLLKNNKAVLHGITVSSTVGDRSIVASGLSAGDTLITSGFINLSENASVIIK